MSKESIPELRVEELSVSGVDGRGAAAVYDDFQVRTFELVERLSEPYSLMLSLASPHPSMSVPGLVGGRCSFRFGRGTFDRNVHGVVFRAETIGVINEQLCVRLWVAPAIEVLALSRRMRVFQGSTVIDIAKDLLDPVFKAYKGSLDTSRIDHALFRRRDCCVQYKETDLEFLQRLLAEEGIAFTFRHGGNEEQMVLLAMTAILHSVAGEDESDALVVPLCSRDPDLAPAESIQNLQGSTRMRASATEAAMWDWKASPPVRTAAREDPLEEDTPLPFSKARFGEVYAFEIYRPVEEQEGGPLCELSGGEANMLGHHQRIEDVRASGHANVCGFTDGATFEVDEHPTEDLDGLYVLLSVMHHAEFAVDTHGMYVRNTGAYGNRFTCHRFRTRVQEGAYEFAPPPRPKPLARGPMMATVVGPAGEEIHTDEHGRIKVRLHWDRGDPKREDHERCCWVPVGQTWAGPGYGAVFVPRVGMEVVISFVGGDPDRPLCTGVVYNGQNRPPYALPDTKTRSVIKSASSPGGGGFNELSFEDAAGSEEVFLHAQRNLREVVGRYHSTSVHGSQSCSVAGDQRNTVGGDQSNKVDKNQSELVEGDAILDVGGERRRTVVGNDTLIVDAARSVLVNGTESHQVHRMLTEKFDGGRTTVVANSSGEVVSSGDKAIAVEEGAVSISAKTAIMIAQNGAHTVQLADGATVSTTTDFTVTNGRASVSSRGGALTVSATDELSLTCGAASIVLKKDGTIDMQGAKKVTAGAGPITTFVAEPGGVTINGPKITSLSLGVYEIVGALVKINS